MNRIVITIDGLVASGKSSLARALAARLGFAHLNSGLLYRGVGIIALHNSLTADPIAALNKLVQLIDSSSLKLVLGEGGKSVLEIAGEDVTELAQQDHISQLASKFSVFAEVRKVLFKAQREAFYPAALVAEGRDMGTVMFPEAQLKFFVETELKERVRRRMVQSFPEYAGFDAQKQELLRNKVQAEILERDHRDSERELSPTKPADDAICIDNSSRPLTEVVQSMYDLALARGLCRLSVALSRSSKS